MQNTVSNVYYLTKSYIGSVLVTIFSFLTLSDLIYSVGIVFSVLMTILNYKSNKKRNDAIYNNTAKRTEIIKDYLDAKIPIYRSPEEALGDCEDILVDCNDCKNCDKCDKGNFNALK